MKKRYLILLGLLILMSEATFSQSIDKLRLTLREDPSTTAVIGWNQIAGTSAVVHYGKVDEGQNWESYANSFSGISIVDYLEMSNSYARLTGLEPNTAYYFVIKDSEGVSERYWFKTLPDQPTERLSLIAGGDSRNNWVVRRNANTLVAKLKPHAVLFSGDMTIDGTSEQWAQWFDDWQYTITDDGKLTQLVVARGNHESSNEMMVNLFDVPHQDVYYALNLGGDLLRAYTLNSEISVLGNQTDWFANDLTSNTNTKWKYVQYHRSIRPHVSSKPEMNDMYDAWSSLFYENGVDLVAESDAHIVKSTWPIRPSVEDGNDEGFVRDDQNGTVYIGEGGWGAGLRTNDDEKSWTRDHGKFNQFKLIFVDQDKIEVRTIKTYNADEVTAVTNDDVFVLPPNLDIWQPSNGEVLVIGAENELPDYNVPPNAPSELSIKPISPSQIMLTWRDNANNDQGFEIEQSLDGGTFDFLATIVTNGRYYLAKDLGDTTKYYYRVRAMNSGGKSSYTSVEDTATFHLDQFEINVDGNLDEWKNVEALAVAAGQSSQVFKWYDDEDYYYASIAGYKMGSAFQLFIDIDNDPTNNYQDTHFESSGAEYYIENTSLYISTGPGWSWMKIGSGIAKNDTHYFELKMNKKPIDSIGAITRIGMGDLVNWTFNSQLPAFGTYATYENRFEKEAIVETPLAIGDTHSKIDNVRIFPNPIDRNQSLVVWFTLEEPTRVEMRLYDSSGKLIQTEKRGSISSGEHELGFQIKHGRVDNGIYFLHMYLDDRKLVKKIIVK